MSEQEYLIEAIRKHPTGGQTTAYTDSGVKVTHIETGLTASCSTERSQLRNRKVATEMVEYGLLATGFK